MATIGFAGLGMMGEAMVRRLIAKGHAVAVWNRTRDKCEPLQEAGATVCTTLQELSSSHSLIMTMLSTSEVLDEVAVQIRSFAARGTVHVDMSTVSPRTTQRCAEAAGNAGQSFVHAPVLGSVPQVESGTLLVFAGGDDASVARARNVFEAMSSNVYRFPRPEDATRMKLTCNFFIASMIMTLGQGLSFAKSSGLDGDVLLDVLGRSALGAPMYATKGKNILDDNFSPRFFLEHMLKDIRLFRDAAADLDVKVPFVPGLEDMFARAAREGLGQADYSAVVKLL